MAEYRAQGGPGTVAFATKLPGHIVPVEVSLLGGEIVTCDLAPDETLRVHCGHVRMFAAAEATGLRNRNEVPEVANLKRIVNHSGEDWRLIGPSTIPCQHFSFPGQEVGLTCLIAGGMKRLREGLP